MKFEWTLVMGIVLGAALSSVCFSLAAIRLMGILQQEGYQGGAMVKYTFRKGSMQRKRLSLLALSLALLCALFDLCFCFLPKPWGGLMAVLPYFGLIALYLWSEKKYALKVPFRPTPRAVRLAVLHAVLLALLCTGMGFGLAALSLWADMGWLYLFRFVPFALLPLLLPFTLACANFLAKGYEIPHGRRFLRRAAASLRASDCIKVGITGSFGKTSVKHYAAQILSARFRVIATPASYNTPLGVARCINEGGLDCDVFLAEMGARRWGDIGALCDLVQPEIGVVTGICPQHLLTFGSLEAISAEKGVLAQRCQRVVLGRSAAHLREDAMTEGREFSAEDVVLSEEGSSFTLRLGEDRIAVKTGLVGRHAAEDVALAAALCSLLGMTAEEIAARIPTLTPAEHRLQKMAGADVTILDDSYNSNPDGAKNAVEALRVFEGKKIVVTPGLVELGELEEGENEALGAELVGLDGVILVGETQALAVRNGYLAAGGREENIFVVPTLEKAKQKLSVLLGKGGTVLFLNDLPDKY